MSVESSPSTATHFSSSWKQFSMLYSIPFSGWSSVSIAQDHVHPSHKHTHAHTNNGGHSTDCLLYSPERLATWLLLTFNRVHYSGRALIQLLHNTGVILRVFLAPLWAFPAPSTLNLSPCVHLSYHQRSLSYFTSTQRPASCLYTCPRGVSYLTTVEVPCPPNISSLVYRWLMVPPSSPDNDIN